MKDLQIILCLFFLTKFAYSQKVFTVKNYPLYFTETKYKSNAENKCFMVNQNNFIQDSCIFYESHTSYEQLDFYEGFPNIIYKNINWKNSKLQDSLMLTFIKVKKDSIFKSPKSYLNIIELFYKSQGIADTIFKRINQKSEFDYPVIPLDWAFYLTKNKSVIIIFSEGYRHDAKLFKQIDKMIKENNSTTKQKYLIDKVIIPKF